MKSHYKDGFKKKKEIQKAEQAIQQAAGPCFAFSTIMKERALAILIFSKTCISLPGRQWRCKYKVFKDIQHHSKLALSGGNGLPIWLFTV